MSIITAINNLRIMRLRRLIEIEQGIIHKMEEDATPQRDGLSRKSTILYLEVEYDRLSRYKEKLERLTNN